MLLEALYAQNSDFPDSPDLRYAAGFRPPRYEKSYLNRTIPETRESIPESGSRGDNTADTVRALAPGAAAGPTPEDKGALPPVSAEPQVVDEIAQVAARIGSQQHGKPRKILETPARCHRDQCQRGEPDRRQQVPPHCP